MKTHSQGLKIMNTLNWTFLEITDVANYLANDQLTFLSNYNVGDNQTLLCTIIKDVCAYIQEMVPEKLRPNPLAGNHLPLSCKICACHLVIEAVQTRVPDLKLSEDQIRNAQQARSTLENFHKLWSENFQKTKIVHKLEAVHFRPNDANYKTLKGL